MGRLLTTEVRYKRAIGVHILTVSGVSFLSVHFCTPISGKPVASPSPSIVGLGDMFSFCPHLSRHDVVDATAIFALCSQTGLIFFWGDLRNSMSKSRIRFAVPPHTAFGIGILAAILCITFISTAGTVSTYQEEDTHNSERMVSWLHQSERGASTLFLLGSCLTFGKRKFYVR